jgi:hypothetical protein
MSGTDLPVALTRNRPVPLLSGTGKSVPDFLSRFGGSTRYSSM